MSVLRSMLFVPTLKTKFHESASKSGADAVILDLEDSVAIPEKDNARKMLSVAVDVVGRGGADVLIRINNEPEHLKADLEASVIPGVTSLMIPKVEFPEQVTEIAKARERVENKRARNPGSINIDVTIETAKGLVEIEKILKASQRIISIGFGAGDYCRDLNITPSPDGLELMYAFSKVITYAKAAGVQPKGLLGTLINVRDLEGFEQMALRSRRLGSTGTPCVHPSQVEILNRIFSPSKAELAWARRVVEEFEKRSSEGEAAFTLDGKMIDYANYYQAKDVIAASGVSEPEKTGID